MRVIVHGLHRTGSKSTRTALHMLGFYECYHMVSVFNDLENSTAKWTDAIKTKFAGEGKPYTREDWDKLLGQSQACVDLPTALFTLELVQAYPEAKVVMLNRDPEKWYESVLATVYNSMKPPSGPFEMLQVIYMGLFVNNFYNWAKFGQALGKYAMPFDHAKEKDKAIEWFKKSYQEVRDAIPSDQRLEFSVKDGWKPLCDWLDVPVPMVKDEKSGELVEAPFPRVNEREEFVQRVQYFRKLQMREANGNMLSIVGKVVTTGLLAYSGYLMWRTRIGGRI